MKIYLQNATIIKKTYFDLSILEKKKNLRSPILMNTQLKISSPTNLIVYAHQYIPIHETTNFTTRKPCMAIINPKKDRHRMDSRVRAHLWIISSSVWADIFIAAVSKYLPAFPTCVSSRVLRNVSIMPPGGNILSWKR